MNDFDGTTAPASERTLFAPRRFDGRTLDRVMGRGGRIPTPPTRPDTRPCFGGYTARFATPFGTASCSPSTLS